MALLSIVLPSYNEEQNIANTSKVLSELLEQEKIEYELVFVSDGSKDATYEEILKAAEKNPRIKGAKFSRNFGKEACIFAGLRLTTGDAVIVMDCDLQHPPELLTEMIENWQQGFDVVYMTADPNDPVLQNKYQHIKGRFIGEGNKAFAKLNFLFALANLYLADRRFGLSV